MDDMTVPHQCLPTPAPGCVELLIWDAEITYRMTIQDGLSYTGFSPDGIDSFIKAFRERSGDFEAIAARCHAQKQEHKDG